MKILQCLTLFLSIFCLNLPVAVSGQETGEEFKVAGVDIQRVFQEFHKTRQTEATINEERIRIQKMDRELRSQITMMDKKIIAERKKLEKLASKAEGEEGEELKKEKERFQRLVDDRVSLNDERRGRYEQSNRRLNQDMVKTMRGLLGEIRRFVVAHGEEGGYDLVLDLSGTSTNQTSPVLGGKGILDITATVIAKLNKDDPSLREKK